MTFGVTVGTASVIIGENRGGGLTSHQLAKRAVQKLLHVSASAHPALREQANAYRERIYAMLVPMFDEAMASERKRVTKIMEETGQQALASAIME